LVFRSLMSLENFEEVFTFENTIFREISAMNGVLYFIKAELGS
jgi:hypothetical protein